jgi:hypothetical protein
LAAAARQYRRDRTEGQDLTPLIIIEKATLATQMSEWFGEPLGIMIAPLRGYSSVSFDDEIRAALDGKRRYRVLYVGDFDPSGEDIERHAEDEIAIPFWERVAVLPEQIDEYGLPENPGKSTDSRAGAFAARHGRLVQVEVEARDPDDLRALVQQAIDAEWDTSAFQAVIEREDEERDRLEAFADEWEPLP